MTASYLAQAVDALVPGHEAALAALADMAAAANGETAVTEDTGAAFTADDTEFNVFNTDRKLAAIEAICEVLDGIPGKKSLIQFTGGITQTGEENRSELIAATNSANRSNVSIYSVDSRGLLNGHAGRRCQRGGFARHGDVHRRDRDFTKPVAAGFARHSGDPCGRHGRALLLRCRRFRQSVSERAERHFRLLPGGLLQHRYKARWQLAAHQREESIHCPLGRTSARARDTTRQKISESSRRKIASGSSKKRSSRETPEVELPVAVETAQFRLNNNQVFVPIVAKLASSALQWAQKRGSHETAFDFAAEVREAKSNRVVGALRDTITVKIDAEHFQDIQQRSLVYQGGIIAFAGRSTS